MIESPSFTPPVPNLNEDGTPKRWALNPDNGMLSESARGAWVRHVDHAAVLANLARTHRPVDDADLAAAFGRKPVAYRYHADGNHTGWGYAEQLRGEPAGDGSVYFGGTKVLVQALWGSDPHTEALLQGALARVAQLEAQLQSERKQHFNAGTTALNQAAQANWISHAAAQSISGEIRLARELASAPAPQAISEHQYAPEVANEVPRG